MGKKRSHRLLAGNTSNHYRCSQMMPGALSGITVLEIGEMISAPFCSKLMADLGAEVIKIEMPFQGDRARQTGPFPQDVPDQEKSGLFLYLNANKLGITLNVGDPEGQRILHVLTQRSDVIVHNLPPEQADALRLTYKSLKLHNEGIVVCGISSFGRTGPYKDFKSTCFTSCHISGVASVVGEPDREPLTLPEDRSAYFAGINAAGAILCALFGRQTDGEGQDVDISETDILAGLLMGSSVTRAVIAGQPTPRMGHRMAVAYPHAVLPCLDGHVALVAFEDDQFQRLLAVMGNPEWGSDEIFRTKRSRAAVVDALEDLLLPWFKEHTREEIFHLCQGNRVPTVPFYAAGEAMYQPHMIARGFFSELEHPVAGRLSYPGAPYRLSKSPWAVRRAAPKLGEHNYEIYCGRLGLFPEDCSRLRDRSVI